MLRYFCTIVLSLIVLLCSSCQEDVLNPTVGEQYEREFIKEFGSFKAHNWSMARQCAITVNVPVETAVDVCADIAGTRYCFARFSRLQGRQTIPVRIPQGVETMVVEAYDGEFEVQVGGVIDLTNASRAYASRASESSLATLGYIKYEADNDRTISFSGRSLKSEVFGGIFKFENNANFYAHGNNDGFFLTSFVKPNSSGKFVNVFPLYWRENQYGESDYLLGVYVTSSATSTQEARISKIIDLDIDVKAGIQISEDGNVVRSGDGKKAYDLTNILDQEVIQLTGTHIDAFEDGVNSNNFRIGFCLKSGLKETSTEQFGRDYEHISFQMGGYNYYEWGDGCFWDTPLLDVMYAYSGAYMTSKDIINFKNVNWGTVPSTELTDGNNTLKLLGFASPPSKKAQERSDFCDCVFLVQSCTSGINITTRGGSKSYWPWVLCAEDMGSIGDWDFNDVIVNVYDVTSDYTSIYLSKNTASHACPKIIGRHIAIVPRAAGGTLPVYLMYTGKLKKGYNVDATLAELLPEVSYEEGTFMLGTELHRWLGADDHLTPLNVMASGNNEPILKGRAISFTVPEDLDAVIDNKFNYPQDVNAGYNPISGLWVLVDKNDRLKLYNSNKDFDPTYIAPTGYFANKVLDYHQETKHAYVRFSGTLGNGVYAVEGPSENSETGAPQMLVCFRDYEWPIENMNIAKAYTNFRGWIAGEIEFWHPGSNTTIDPPISPGTVVDKEAFAVEYKE